MRKFLSLLLITVSLLMAAGLPASGAPVSAQTPFVKGHVPVASAVTITGSSTPVVGDTLHLGATFSDPDGDAESGSLLRWYHGDGTAIAGATGPDYVIQVTDAGKRIQGGYTPKTDPAITDPATGVEVKSALTVLIMGKPDGAKSTFTQDKTLIAATGSDKAVLTLTLKDSAGNPVSGIAGRLSLAHTATAGTDAVSLTTDDKGAGVYAFLVTGTEAGTVVFTPQLDGATLTTTPPSLTLVLTGDSSTAQITASDLTVTADNAVADDSARNSVKAIVTDAAGRPVQNVTVSFTTVLPARITTSTGVTDINGVATASLASPQAGPVAVTAKINSTGSEQAVSVNFKVGAPSAATSTLSAGTASITANNGGTGGTSVLTLTLKDTNGNPVTGLADVAFTVTGVTGTALTTVTESPANSGIYTATLSGITAGTATVSTTVGGSAFSATPATVSVTLTADASTAKVSTVTETTGGALANNTATNTLTATVTDANNNPVSGVTVNWSVTTGIATLSGATSTTDVSGQAIITAKDTTAETATMTAKVGANAADTGRSVNTAFGLYPVILAGGISNAAPATNNSPADGATQNTLIVQVSDLAGNAIKNTATTLNFTGTDLKTGPATLKSGATGITAASTALAVTTDANGQVTLTATDITAESITVSAKVSTSTQAAVTQTSTFGVYPVLSAAETSITLDGAPSDAASLNTVQVIVRDLKGNTLTGQTVNWTMSSPSGKALFSPAAATTATSTTNASGAATISLTDRRMESVTVTAKAGSGLPVQTQSKTTTFLQYANLTITSVINTNCIVSCTVTVNANARDIDGNPLSGLKLGSFSNNTVTGNGASIVSTDVIGNASIARLYSAAITNDQVYAYARSNSNPGVISDTRSANGFEYASAPIPVTTLSLVTWSYVPAANALRTASLPGGYTGSANCRTNVDLALGRYNLEPGSLVIREPTLDGASSKSCITKFPYESPDFVVEDSGSIVYMSPVSATYTYAPTVWKCPSSVTAGMLGTPGTKPAACTDVSPATTTVANATNASPGWTHTP